MAFLQIDGLTIPVDTKSPRKRYEEIGAFSRSVSGSGIFGIRSAKRSWDVSTTPMSRDDAEALAALLSGRGLYFSFLASNPNATNGYVPPASHGLVYTGISTPRGAMIIQTTAGDIQIVDATHNPFSGYANAWSINFWLYRNSATDEYVFDSSSGVFFYINAAGAVNFGITGAICGTTLALTTWYAVTGLMIYNGDGTVRAELWVNGALAASATSTAWSIAFPSLDALTSFYLGSNNSGTSNFAGLILQPIFVPGRLTQRWISAIYNATTHLGVILGDWPQHRVTGTMVGNGVLNAFVRNISAEPVDSPGLVAAERLTFTISEA